MYMHKDRELNRRRYCFCLKYSSTRMCVCVCLCFYNKVPSQFVAEPQTGFQIAFKMLDTDGNEQVEKKEFFKVCVFICILILKHLNSFMGYICRRKIH